MDILTSIISIFAGLLLFLAILSILFFILIIGSLIFLYKQAKKNPKFVLYSLIGIIIFAVIFGVISFETVIGSIGAVIEIIGAFTVLALQWKHLKKEI